MQATNAIASGAGIAQVSGSGIYFIARRFTLPHGTSFYIFIVVNVIGILVFFLLLEVPTENSDCKNGQHLWTSDDDELEIVPLMLGQNSLNFPTTESSQRVLVLATAFELFISLHFGLTLAGCSDSTKLFRNK